MELWHFGGRAIGFDAFISYSHSDASVASAIERGLGSLAKPWHQRRALAVYRDQSSQAATAGLWDSIQDALAQARFLVLLASPESAKSPWVTREIAWWLANRDSNSLIICLTDGELTWAETGSRFLRPADVPLPTPLLDALHNEPLWVDLRWLRDVAGQPSIGDPRFRTAVADIAAPIHGLPKDALIGEDVRQHRRTVRLARGSVASLAALTLLAMTAALIARHQRDNARRQTRVSLSRALAASASSLEARRLDLAMLLAAHAVRVHDTPQARSALLSAVTASPHLGRFGHEPADVTALATNTRYHFAIVGSADGAIRQWSPSTGQWHRWQQLDGLAITALADSRDHSKAIAGTAGGTVAAFDAVHRSLLNRGHILSGRLIAVAGTSDGRFVAASTDRKLVVAIWRKGRPAPLVTYSLNDSTPSALAFIPGRRLRVGFANGQAIVIKWLSGSVQTLPGAVGPGDSGWIGGWSTRATTFAEIRAPNVFATRAESGADVRFPSVAPTGGEALAVDRAGTRLALAGPDGVVLIDAMSSGAELPVALPGLAGAAPHIAFADADATLVIEAVGTDLAAWDLKRDGRVGRRLGGRATDLPEAPAPEPLVIDRLGRPVWAQEDDFRHARGIGQHLICPHAAPVTVPSFIYALAPSPDGETLAGGGMALSLWRRTANCWKMLSFSNVLDAQGTSAVVWLAYGSGGRLITLRDQGSVGVASSRTGRFVRSLRREPVQPSAHPAALTRAMRSVLVGRRDGAIDLINTETGRLERRSQALTQPVYALAAQAHGRLAAVSAFNSDPVLIDIESGRIMRRLGGAGASTLAFSLDGKWLAGVGSGGTAVVWDVVSGTMLAQFAVGDPPLPGAADRAALAGVAFDHANHLWIGEPGNRATVWSLTNAAMTASVCSTVGRDLSDDEVQEFVGTKLSALPRCHA